MTVSRSRLFTERSLEVFWNTLESGVLDKSVTVLGSLGYSAATLDYVLNPENYFIPNNRTGILVRPKNMSEDSIAIFAVEPQEKLLLPTPTSFHPIQVAALEKSTISDLDEMQGDLRYRQHWYNSSDTNDSQAVSASTIYRIAVSENADPSTSLILTHPSIALHMTDEPTVDAVCPGVILHEFAHLLQVLDKPIEEPHAYLDRELEAYGVQSKLLMESEIEYSPDTAMAVTVDQFRRSELGPNTYKSTPEFRQKAKAHPVVTRIVDWDNPIDEASV